MRRRSGRALAAGLLGALAVAAPAAANDAGSVSHSAGSVTATAEWDAGTNYSIANPRFYVVRAGIRYDITIVDICDEGCILLPDDPGASAEQSILHVADLDGDGEPEVLLDTFSGGAHCCVTTRLLTWNGTGYTPTDESWRDEGYVLRDADGDGRQELVGHDPRFAGFFTAFAASAPPLLVFQVDHGTFVDVTRKFPKELAADAASLRKDLRRIQKRKGYDVRGLLAAYVADLYNLGRGATARAELRSQRRAHRITAKFGPHLLRQLKAWGYPVR